MDKQMNDKNQLTDAVKRKRALRLLEKWLHEENNSKPKINDYSNGLKR